MPIDGTPYCRCANPWRWLSSSLLLSISCLWSEAAVADSENYMSWLQAEAWQPFPPLSTDLRPLWPVAPSTLLVAHLFCLHSFACLNHPKEPKRFRKSRNSPEKLRFVHLTIPTGVWHSIDGFFVLSLFFITGFGIGNEERWWLCSYDDQRPLYLHT